LDLFALMQKTFDLLESVAEVADRGFSHVIHLSITTGNWQIGRINA
jgi:hypothetical protein